MKIDKTIIIIAVILAILILVVIAVLVWQSGNIFSFFNKGEKVNFSPGDYANQKGYIRYFQHQGQWYANINGKWETVASKDEAKKLSVTGSGQ